MMDSLNSTAGDHPAVRSIKYEFKNWVLKYQNIVSMCVTGGALLKEKPVSSGMFFSRRSNSGPRRYF